MSLSIGPFAVEGEIGRGVSGIVYRARSREGTLVALRLLPQDANARAAADRARSLLASVGAEPGFVPILAVGHAPEGEWIATPFFADTLRARLARGPLAVGEALELTLSVARTLEVAHDHGTAHDGLKPENVLLDESGRPFVADLGLARRQEPLALGPARDVFALGAMLQECLTGLAPRQVPAWVDAVVATALAAAPASRWKDAGAFARALAREAVTGTPPTGDEHTPIVYSVSEVAKLKPPVRVVSAGGLEVRIGRVLGRGGMGVVFEGTASDGRRVAVKQFTGAGTRNREKRFERELRMLAELDHPNVVGFIAAGEKPPCLVMEFIEGRDLQTVLLGGRLSPDRAAAIVADAASGLAHAHERGLIHRDVKPANIMVRASDGRGIVTDFGLAKALDVSTLTDAGVRVGTYLYMAPEQLDGNQTDASDVWALGVVLFECLAGKHPFGVSETAIAVMTAIATGKSMSPRDLDPAVPVDLDEICQACLMQNPALRPSAATLAARLRARKPAPRPRRWPRILAALATVAALAAGLAAGSRVDRPPPAPDPSVVFSLARGDVPALTPRTLWADASGRTARPLEGRLPEAFTGRVSPRGGGRIAVEYDLARSRFVSCVAGMHFALGGALSLLRDSRGPSGSQRTEITAPNDAGAYAVWVGEGRWIRPRVRFDVEATYVDQTALALFTGELRVSLEGRAALVHAGAVTATGFDWKQLRGRSLTVYPGAPRGERLVVSGQGPPAWVAAIDAALEEAAAGPVSLQMSEGTFLLSAVSIEGVPIRPDVAARAVVTASIGSAARVEAAFETAGGVVPSGGPFVALGSPATPIELELDGGTLVLRRDHDVLESRPLPVAPLRGLLSLERRGESIVGLLRDDAGATIATLEAVDPLAPQDGWRAAYGSTAPTVRFDEVAVRTVTPMASLPARARWREGARGLALVADPERGEPGWVGGKVAARAERRRLAAKARDDLLAAAELAPREPAVRADALARAVFASVIAGDGLSAGSTARELVALEGQAAAFRHVDALGRNEQGVPHLMEELIQGYPPYEDDGTITLAGTDAARVLAPPGRQAEIVAARGSVTFRRVARGPLDAVNRAALEALIAEAPDLGGVTNDVRYVLLVNRARARLLLRKNPREGLADIQSALAIQPGAAPAHYWRALLSGAVGDAKECLASLTEAVALDNRNEGFRSELVRYADAVAASDTAGELRGLEACALHAVGRLRGDKDLMLRARELAASATGRAEGEDADLRVYVLACESEILAGTVPAGARPTAALARARIGPSLTGSLLADLHAATAGSELVGALVRLDPELAGR